MFTAVFVALSPLVCSMSWCFNIDIDFPTVLSGDPGSYFGYTVAINRNGAGKNLALVGAIRANSSLQRWRDIYEPGVLFQCPLLEQGRPCAEVVVERSGNRDTPSAEESLRYYDLKDNMTLGMTLETTPQGKIVVCGPLWKNQKWFGVRLANGVCYVMDRDFSRPKKLLPLVKRNLQVVYYDYYYYAAECGFSATFTKRGDLVLGAPGFLNWKGSVVRYDSSLERHTNPSVSIGRHQGVYIGYSMASGRFFKDEEASIATGAPRGNDYRGEVYLLASTGSTSRGKLLGNQLGEYFGASLLAIDLDKDAGHFDDLLVGAPQFTQPNGMDEGRVYIYLSSGSGLYSTGSLEGNRVPGSRFGTSIANLGDINMDGFDDIAVGAPYEDAGAVYIYHGSRNLGSRSAYAQRISASAITARTAAPVKGFGISISRGYDVDSNRYKDVLVGAYQSDNAVLLRTRPVIQANGSIDADIAMITPEVGHCEISDGRTLSCFMLKLCLSYSGMFVKNELEFDTELTIDTKRIADGRPVRGFMYNGTNQVNRLQATINARVGFSTCVSRIVYLHTSFVDPVIPFEVRFAYDLKKPAEARWCPDCPVLDPNQPLSVSKMIPYQHGCREDDVCRSDLKLDVDISNYDPDTPFVVGEQATMSVDVQVHNKRSGDPAYLSRVLLKIPSTVGVVNKDRCSVLDDLTGVTTIVCDAGNPLRQELKEKFLLKLDLSKVLRTFTLNASATTTSEEVDPKDNYISRTLPFIYQADVAILGRARPDIVEYNKDTKNVLMEHSFVITKQYSSPIRAVELSVYIPYVFSESGMPFSSIKNIKTLGGDLFVPGTCRSVEGYVTWKEDTGTEPTDVTSLSRNGTGISGRVQRSADPGETVADELAALRAEASTQVNFDNVPPLNCRTSLCHEVKCTLGPFLSRTKVAQVIFYVVFDMEEFIKQAGIWYAFSVGSEGAVRILDNITFVGVDDQQKEIRVATILQKQGPLPAKKVAPWIIAVSAFAGVLVFSLLLAALIHLGFFRRRQREALDRLREQNEDSDWNEFMVTEAEVQAEKEFFRKSMMLGNTNGELDFTGMSASSTETLAEANGGTTLVNRKTAVA